MILDGNLKKTYLFLKQKILNYDILDSKTGKILISKGTKVNQKIINEFKKKNIFKLTIQ